MQYVVYGNKHKGVLRPLSIIDFTSSRRNNSPAQMATISSVSLLYTPQALTTDIQRQCVAMFLAEVLLHTLRHPMSDQPLFNWLCQLIQHLDQTDDISNLHLEFLLEYATLLGIGVDDNEHPDWFTPPTTRLERQQRLRELSAYYAEHIEDFRPPKSLDILMEVFD
jgi:DNA repair protein RecO (recombination protein O)